MPAQVKTRRFYDPEAKCNYDPVEELDALSNSLRLAAAKVEKHQRVAAGLAVSAAIIEFAVLVMKVMR